MNKTITIIAAPLTVALAAILLSGCEQMDGPARSAEVRPGDSASVRLADANVATARRAAVQVLKQHFRIDNEATTGVVLRSRPLEVSTRGDAEGQRMSEVLSGRTGRRRQIAEVEVIERGPDVLVRCRVQVQRLDTQERAAFSQQRGSEDRPAEMNRNETTSPTQTRLSEDWVDAGRDRQLERTMLDEISELVTGKGNVETRPVP